MIQDTTDATSTITTETIPERVREKYAAAARAVQAGGAVCCGGADGAVDDPITSDLYTEDETAALPEEAVLASLGCGNPTALIDLRPGQTVLDLGSGGGIDVLLSARRVGPTGFVFGVDMTDEMLALAQANKQKAGLSNVAFLKGRIEEIPLPAASVDVVISNCVINLAADKAPVLREAFRVPADLRRDMEAWVGCLAGALEIDTYKSLLAEAGFTEIGVEITRRYTVAETGLDPRTLPAGWEQGDGKLASAFVRATKPLAVTGRDGAAMTAQPQAAFVAVADRSCCAPECCA